MMMVGSLIFNLKKGQNRNVCSEEGQTLDSSKEPQQRRKATSNGFRASRSRRCALVPVGITTFTKLIERATAFEEVIKEQKASFSFPLVDFIYMRWKPLSQPGDEVSSRFCRYHRRPGHGTGFCKTLSSIIHDRLTSGELKYNSVEGAVVEILDPLISVSDIAFVLSYYCGSYYIGLLSGIRLQNEDPSYEIRHSSLLLPSGPPQRSSRLQNVDPIKYSELPVNKEDKSGPLDDNEEPWILEGL
ncbi:hypothetical protein NE237_008240 [Protea cynaroides]|uniref:Uncharacterized protein n=1 Tax=Protea cynaroides TaxID=273540 RepID=A0A9Q0GP47_9MAGN|nr:hypothetical protein NE237_008240 [Protea cynaroides]